MDSDIYKNIGRNISILLIKNSMYQKELAKKIGMDHRVLSGIILCKKKIKVHELKIVAEGLNVTIGDLCKNDIDDIDSIEVILKELRESNNKRTIEQMDRTISEINKLKKLLRV